MTWYLILGALYLGPYTEPSCKMAVVYLAGTICKQADHLYACAVDGRPGTYTTCPYFTYPEVKIK